MALARSGSNAFQERSARSNVTCVKSSASDRESARYARYPYTSQTWSSYALMKSGVLGRCLGALKPPMLSAGQCADAVGYRRAPDVRHRRKGEC